MTQQTLEITLCLNSSKTVPAWVYHSISEINKVPLVEIVALIIIPENKKPISFNRLLTQVLKRLKSPPFNNNYAKQVALKPLLKNTAEYRLNYQKTNTVDIDLTQIPNTDLIINYTQALLVSLKNKHPSHGIWNHLFNNNGNLETTHSAIKETYLNQPTLICELRSQCTGSAQSQLITSASTCPSDNSIEQSNHYIHWRASRLAQNAIHQLLINPQTIANNKELKLHHNTLSSFSLGRYFFNYLLQRLTKKIQAQQYFEQWVLFYKFTDDNNPNSAIDMSSFTPIKPPKDKFWADPHIVVDNGHYYIFFEELPYATWKGHLAVIEINKNGTISPATTILNTNYHLSYPHIFKHDGCYYMIPETAQNKTIELYRCTDFPYQWEFVNNLMEDVVAVDTTLYFEGQHCWLFTNIKAVDGAPIHDELSLFYSNQGFLHQQWISHPQNPIISNVESARPAGKLFMHEGKLYRPSQDCSHHYGYGYNLNEVTQLTETEYQEEQTQKVTPDWDVKVIATHTYNHIKGLTLCDGILIRKK